MSAIHRLAFVCLVLSLNSAAAQPNPGTSDRVRRDFQSVPVHFEPNRGQSDPAAGFIARTATGLTAVLRDGSVLLSRGGDRIGIRVASPSSKPVLVPEGPQAGRSSYYLADQRIEGVPHYSRVRAKDVRPGMDVVYYGAGRLLEYDLVFRPGADPFKARLQFTSGVPVLNAEGELVLRSGTTEFVQRKPVAWQSDGRGERTPVDCSYVLLASGDVRFRLGAYDRSRELTIDPVITYSTYLGGSDGYDRIYAVAVDSSGAAVVTGYASSMNFPGTSGVKPGSADVFVTKFAPNGNSIQWSVLLGGSNSDYGSAIATDAAGSVYVGGLAEIGTFAGTAMPANTNGFVVKLSSQGVLAYVRAFANSGNSFLGTQINGIAADANGNVWATGVTAGSVGTAGAYRAASAGGQDAFVARLSPSGTVQWCTHVGGSSADYGAAIAVDAAGNSHITGWTDSVDFPMVSPLDTSVLNGDAYITTVNAAGTALLFSTYFGGSLGDSGNAIAVDSTGRILIAGTTSSADFYTTPAAFQPSKGSNYSGYVVSLLGGAQPSIEYSSYIGDACEVQAIAIDAPGRAVLAGFKRLYGSFPTTPGALTRMSAAYASDDAFLAQVSPGGSTLAYSTLLGRFGEDKAYALALDSTGAAIVAGETQGGGFPTTPGAYLANPQAPSNMSSGWISRIDLSSPTLCQIDVSPSSINVVPQGGAFSFTITVPQGCPWEATPDNRITLATRSGMGTGAPVPLAATISGGDSNPSVQRIRFGDSTLTLNQPAWTCSDPAFTPSTLTFDSAGGIRTINAAFPDHCLWTATPSVPWISVQSGSSGSGTATISVYAPPNAFGARSGSVVIGGKSVPVTQSAGACSSSVSADPATFGASGGSGTAAIVVTGPNCSWTSHSTIPWIAFEGASTGTGSGSVRFRVAQNPGSVVRVGQLLFGDRQLTFTQAAGPSGVPLTYTQSYMNIDANGLAIDVIAATPSGTLIFFDNGRVRELDDNGRITTLAGGGSSTDDGVPALSAQISSPWAFAVNPATGAVYYTDGARVRVIAGGVVRTVAGTGVEGFTGDGGPAISAQIGFVSALAADSTGALYIADRTTGKIRRVSNGIISTFAGGGTAFADGVVPTATNLDPVGIAVDAPGAVYIADQRNHRIRKISNGVITTIAGGGTLTGSGIPALSASIFISRGAMAVDALGAVYVIESSWVVKVTPDGYVYRIADDWAFRMAIHPSANLYLTTAGASTMIRVLTPTPQFCSYSVTAPAPQPAAGGVVSLTVTTGAGCAWNASSGVGWIQAAGATQTGTGTITLTLPPNTGAARTGMVTIAGQSVTLTQAAGAGSANSQDLNADGTPDLILQNTATRQAIVWYMQANPWRFASYDWLAAAGPTGWSIAATGDLNRDGRTDILWQNDTTQQVTVWYMGGAAGNTMTSFAWLAMSGTAGWRLASVADVNRDGVLDILWQHNSTAQLIVWYMGGAGGATMTGWNWISSGGVPGWRLAGTGDFNGDGSADLVLQNTTTSQVTVWYMGGAGGVSLTGWNWIVNPGLTGWTVAAVMDSDRDGKPDIVWQNNATQQATVWRLGGAGGNTLLGYQWIAMSGTGGWRMVGGQ